MSTFLATITDIQNEGILHIVTFDMNGVTLKMMSLDLDKNIKISSEVILSVKATAVAIAKEFSGELSYSNQIEATIKTMEVGKLLTSLKVETKGVSLDSIITTSSQKRMHLTLDDKITLLIKSSDLSIYKVLLDV